jgi:hypothetical protein
MTLVLLFASSSYADVETEAKGIEDELGIKFGAALVMENFNEPYIFNASLHGDTNIVHVDEKRENVTSLWLETHYTWDGTAYRWGLRNSAPGFYVGAKMAGENSKTFDGFSLGFMWSFKRKPLLNTKDTSSINVGFGPVWHKTKALANGIEDGSSLPSEFKEVEYTYKDERSWMLMVSFGF